MNNNGYARLSGVEQPSKSTHFEIRLRIHKKGLLIAVAAIAVIGVGAFGLLHKRAENHAVNNVLQQPSQGLNQATKAGQELSGGKCTGSGVKNQLSVSPMKPEDFGFLIPYGEVIGGHVTPIDHQYWTPKDYYSPRDAYPVYAMADATVTSIQPRNKNQGTEYRLVFTQSCTFFYYYDLLTSLTGNVKTAYDKTKNADGFADGNVKVKAGELIGYIGGQTLDFAVWDTTKPLPGFIVPNHYKGESWKIYVANPLDYMAADLKKLVISRDPRVAAPIQGKIDYDVDGRLIGNWFVQGTGGDTGGGPTYGQDYFKNQLSFLPDVYDPSRFIVSIGSLYGQVENDPDMQHMTLSNSPNPKDVTISSGLVKYDLVQWRYLKSDGTQWDQMSFTLAPKAEIETGSPFGCAIAQMTATRLIKFEVFQHKTCANISGFDSGAKIYER